MIDGVSGVARAPEARLAAGDQNVTVTFASGRKAQLDVSQHQGRVWAEVLQSLRETGQPAYVEIEPDTGVITQLLLPRNYTVTALRREKDRLEVELNPSQAIHAVMRSNPYYQEIARALERAHDRGTQVLVTEAVGGGEIVDARLPQQSGQARR